MKLLRLMTVLFGMLLLVSLISFGHSTTACTETDNGLDIYSKGSVNGFWPDGRASTGTDYCKGSVLVEYFCYAGGDEGARISELVCPRGYSCSDGACVQSGSFNGDDGNGGPVFISASNLRVTLTCSPLSLSGSERSSCTASVTGGSPGYTYGWSLGPTVSCNGCSSGLRTVSVGSNDLNRDSTLSVNVIVTDSQGRQVSDNEFITHRAGISTSGSFCGNNRCDIGETQFSCPQDCRFGVGFCGNNICEIGENQFTCPQDCRINPPVNFCGDGICSFNENQFTCPIDCGFFGGSECKVDIVRTDVDPNPFDEDDNVEVSADVRNTGTRQSNIDVKLFIDGRQKETKTKTFRSGETSSFNFFLLDLESDADIRIEAVGCNNARDVENVLVEKDDDLECKVDITDLVVGPNPAKAGDEVDVTVRVKNSGKEENIKVNLIVDNELKDEQTRFLDELERKDFSFTLQNVQGNQDIKVEALTCGGIKDTESEFLRVGEGLLRVIVLDGEKDDERVQGANVKINHKTSSFSKTRFTDGSGSSVFEDIPAGDYEVIVFKEGRQTAFTSATIVKEEVTEIFVTLKKEEKGDLIIIVLDQEGDNLERAKVEIKGKDDDSGTTGSAGFVTFFNIPEGNYDVTVSKKGFKTEKIDVDVEEDRTTERTVILDADDEGIGFHDVEIRKLLFKETVARGESLEIRVFVKNFGQDVERSVKLKLNVFGQDLVSQPITLDRNQEREVKFNLIVPDSVFGEEEVYVEAFNAIVFDSEVSKIFVSDGLASLNIDPETALVNERIHVFGQLLNEKEADLFLEDRFLEKVHADDLGSYSVSFIADKVGTFRVILKGGSFTKAKTLKVIDSLNIIFTEKRDLAVTGESLEVCGTVRTDKTGKIIIKLYDGNFKLGEKTLNNGGTVCFEARFTEEGTKNLRIIAEQEGMKSEDANQLRIITTSEEVTIFPTQHIVERGNDALVRVVLKNLDKESKTYGVEIEEVEGIIISAPVKEATLAFGESKTLFFVVNPHRAGEFDLNVKVISGSSTVREEKLNIFVSTERKNFFQSLGSFFRGLYSDVTFVLLSGIVLIIIMFLAIWVVFLRSKPLEASY